MTALQRSTAMVLCALAVGGAPPAGAEPGSEPRRPIVVRVDDSGFDWSDAGIGGAAVAGLVLVAAGGRLVLRRPPYSERRPS
jgi:hypothetical protein